MADASVRRRGHGDNAIYFAADKNRYIGAVSLDFGPDGRRLRRKVSGKTKQEVRDKLKAIYAELNVGLQSSAGHGPDGGRGLARAWTVGPICADDSAIPRRCEAADGRLGTRPVRQLSAAHVRSALGR
jgi:hypothetical protein